MQIRRNLKTSLLLLMLGGCIGTTPVQQYFELKQHYSVALELAAEYRKTCDEALTDSCKKTVRRLQSADKIAKLSFEQADKAFASADQDTGYKELAYQNAKVAVAALEKLLEGN